MTRMGRAKNNGYRCFFAIKGRGRERVKIHG